MVYPGSLSDYNALTPEQKAQYLFVPSELNISSGGETGSQSQFTILDRQRIEQYSTKSEKVNSRYYFYSKDGKTYLILEEDQTGFEQNVTITEERLQAANPGYDIKSTNIDILEFHIQKNYSIQQYRLLQSLFNLDSNNIDVTITAKYDGQEVLSKKVTYENVPETLTKKSLFSSDEIYSQNLTNFNYTLSIENSFFLVDGENSIDDYINGAYLEDYYSDPSDTTPEQVYKIKLSAKSAGNVINLVYIIRDFSLDNPQQKFSLEVSTGYHMEDEMLKKDNPSISLQINYVPIVLDYTIEDINDLSISSINNRYLYGSGKTAQDPFVFVKGEIISPTAYTRFIPENGVETGATALNLIVKGLDTLTTTEEVREATIIYLPNNIVRYAKAKLYYIVVDEQPVNNVRINGRDYISGQDFIFYEGEKIALNNSYTTIEYLLNGVVQTAYLNATSLNWDYVVNKPYYYDASDNYAKKYRTTLYTMTDFEFYKGEVKLPIDLNNSDVNYMFTENETGVLTIKYKTKIFYPDPNSQGNFLTTNEMIYSVDVPYRVVSKRTIEENETISGLAINRTYPGSIFEFSEVKNHMEMEHIWIILIL